MGNREQADREIVCALKALARDLNVAVVVVSALARGVCSGGADRRPTFSDLFDAGFIDDAADTVLLLHRDDYFNRESLTEHPITEVIVAANRHGPTGTVALKWTSSLLGFGSLSEQEQRRY